MTNTTKRRALAVVLLLLAAIAVVFLHAFIAPFFRRIIYLSGWILLLFMIALAAYNPRKKLPFIPLKSSEAWLKFHLYAGYIAIGLFLIHINFTAPTGRFDSILATLYVLVTVSGIIGLAASRLLPRRLTARGGEVLFERIPMIRLQMRERAESLALASVGQAQASTIADFYVRDLHAFFAGTRNFWSHLSDDRAPVNRLLNKISDLNRFLNEKERDVMGKIADLVRQKDGLDYQFTLQLTLKLWLFIHIPLTYGLLFWSLLHVVIVYAFSGGAGA
jgi:hypothetical protein